VCFLQNKRKFRQEGGESVDQGGGVRYGFAPHKGKMKQTSRANLFNTQIGGGFGVTRHFQEGKTRKCGDQAEIRTLHRWSHQVKREGVQPRPNLGGKGTRENFGPIWGGRPSGWTALSPLELKEKRQSREQLLNGNCGAMSTGVCERKGKSRESPKKTGRLGWGGGRNGGHLPWTVKTSLKRLGNQKQ